MEEIGLNILTIDCSILYDWENIVNSSITEIENLLDITPEIVVFGKKCKQNRDVGFFSDVSEGYNYRKTNTKSKSLTENLKKMIEFINNVTGGNYNGILINRYSNGEDYIGAHSDDKNGLDPISGIVMVSYGQERIFRIRDKKTKKIVKNILTENYQIIQMTNEMQEKYTHEIPKEKKKNGIRYSFTFRNHNK